MVRQAVREASFRSLLPCEDKLPLEARIAASGSAALKTLTNTRAGVNRVLLLNLRGRRRGARAGRSSFFWQAFLRGFARAGRFGRRLHFRSGRAARSQLSVSCC